MLLFTDKIIRKAWMEEERLAVSVQTEQYLAKSSSGIIVKRNASENLRTAQVHVTKVEYVGRTSEFKGRGWFNNFRNRSSLKVASSQVVEPAASEGPGTATIHSKTLSINVMPFYISFRT